MSCENVIDCANLSEPVTISVLPDIVGIGILTSFMVSAAVACGTVIIGYFLDMLPDALLSRIDFEILQRWPRCKPCAQREQLSTIDPIPQLRIPPCQHSDATIAKLREGGLQSFLLALSDAQFATGLAMMIAAYVQHCTLSCYEFQVMSSLGWLSSTTHLATIQGLQQYFRENRAMRNIRAAGMLCNLIMLLFTMFLSTSASSNLIDKSVNLQCVFIRFTEIFDPGMTVLNLALVFIPLFNQYIDAFNNLFYWGSESFLWRTTRRRCCTSSKGPRWNYDEFEQWYEGNVQHSPKNPESQAMVIYLLSGGRNLSEQALSDANKGGRLHAAYIDYKLSFLSTVPGLIYGLAYGVTLVITSRQNKPDLSNSENTVDFGQIVPLFLLILPISSAIETSNDIRKKIGKFEYQSVANKNSLWMRLARSGNKNPSSSKKSPATSIELSTLGGQALEQPPDANPNSLSESSQVLPRGISETLNYPTKSHLWNVQAIFTILVLLNIGAGIANVLLTLLGLTLGIAVFLLDGVYLLEQGLFFFRTYRAVRRLNPSSTTDIYRHRAPPPSRADLTTPDASDTNGTENAVATATASEAGSTVPLVGERDVADAERRSQISVSGVGSGLRRRTTLDCNSEGSFVAQPTRRDTEAQIGL